MKLLSYRILLELIIVSFAMTGCAYPSDQGTQVNTQLSENSLSKDEIYKNEIENDKSGLQRYSEFVTSDNPVKDNYVTSKPDGFKYFTYTVEPVNLAMEGKNYELYALIDPNELMLEDGANYVEFFSVETTFYLELVQDNNHTFYGPFKTKRLDFTQ